MKRFRAAPLFVLISAVALAGCASDADQPILPCPQVAVLQQGQSLTTFIPGHSDVASQITTAQITGVAGACTLRPKKHRLDVTFQAGFAATNGPANNGDTLNLPYFVAITRGNDIIAKSDYNIALKFDGNASTTQATSKPITVEFADQHASSHMQILVGFELTPDQLSYAASHPTDTP
jgi:predicted membrane metal-binding protein